MMTGNCAFRNFKQGAYCSAFLLMVSLNAMEKTAQKVFDENPLLDCLTQLASNESELHSFLKLLHDKAEQAMPFLETLADTQQTLDHMIEKIDHRDGWPKHIKLKQTVFTIYGINAAQWEEALTTICSYTASQRLKKENNIFTIEDTLKIENSEQFLSLLCALTKLKDVITQQTSTTSTCLSCSKRLNQNDAVVLLPCSHRFHLSCVSTWDKKNAHCCPTCKAAFTYEHLQFSGLKTQNLTKDVNTLLLLSAAEARIPEGPGLLQRLYDGFTSRGVITWAPIFIMATQTRTLVRLFPRLEDYLYSYPSLYLRGGVILVTLTLTFIALHKQLTRRL